MKNAPNVLRGNPEFIVGIGASAGGLIPINDFFESVPEETGMAYVVIQHLSPDHKSLMGELLSKHTLMEVYEAEENMAVKSDCVYLIPNQNTMIIEKGKLKLQPKPASKKPNNAIDIFFESLAKDYGKKSIGIILSGTGTDGTMGIEAIKKAGGIVIVQDPMTAEFDGMPNNALSSGYADLVLAPEMIPSEMIDLMHESPVLKSIREESTEDDPVINNILTLVRNSSQHDFSQYKRPTLQRRLAKRMLETTTQTLQNYFEYLTTHPDELKVLSQEFLINVTKFFRDKDAFECLAAQVLPELFNGKNPGDIIKVWSVACSSGEEAYSLAILFQEYMQAHEKYNINVKIFATDVDPEALDTAMRGIYPPEALKDVSHDRKTNFFIEDGKSYRLSPIIRKMVVFAKHDIAKDAPYSKVDLLCCRNMLIYMNPALQNNVLRAFHYSVKEKCFLFLGPSENLGMIKEAFEEVNRKWKIFRCITKAKLLQREHFSHPMTLDRTILRVNNNGQHKNALNHLQEIFYETALEDSYAGILIDKELVVKHAVGKFKTYLNFPESSFNFNLLKLVSVDLSMALSLAIRNAIKEDQKVVMKKVRVHDNDVIRTINIIVRPFLDQKHYIQPFLFIILNEESVEAADKQIVNFTNNEAAVARIDELEKELYTTKGNLQSLIEQVENANEELQSSNEEMSASQEELQSTNEELQSLNEELHTVNAEHQQKIKELNEANDDLNNYFNSSDVSQIFIDKRLLIRRFSPTIRKQINVKDIDLGRSIIDISNNFRSLDFINEIKKVMKSGDRIEKEVTMNNDKFFLMTINPYVRRDTRIDGVIINFTDITQLKSLNTFIEAIFNASRNGIVALKANRDDHYNITGFEYSAVNAEAERIFQATVGKAFEDSFGNLREDFVTLFKEVVEQNTTVHRDFQYGETPVWYQMIATKIEDGVLATFVDITERKQSAELLEKGYQNLQVVSDQLKHFNQQLERSNFDLMQFASVASHDLKEPLRKIQVYGDMLQHKIKEKLDDRENELLDKITKSSGRMKSLIDDVLTFSKLSNSEVAYENIDLNELIKKIVDDLEITICEKKAQVVPLDLPVIKGNVGQINQVFQNLISNALKFNDKRNPMVTIKEEPMTAEASRGFNASSQDYHCIVVEDNGIGFDGIHADKIFGIFQRLNAPSQFEGTGIGLAICKKIIENHKGYIKAESDPGNGSRFMIIFPKIKTA